MTSGDWELVSWIDPAELIPHIASVTPQLKSLTLYEAEFLEVNRGARIPNLGEITLFQKPASLDVQYEQVRNETIGGQGNLWRMLPPTLGRLAIRKIWFVS